MSLDSECSDGRKGAEVLAWEACMAHGRGRCSLSEMQGEKKLQFQKPE